MLVSDLLFGRSNYILYVARMHSRTMMMTEAAAADENVACQ